MYYPGVPPQYGNQAGYAGTPYGQYQGMPYANPMYAAGYGAARPARGRARGRGRGRGFSSKREISSTNVYVSGFPSEWNKDQLYDVFSPCGFITEVRVTTKPGSESNRGVGFVHFSKSEYADKACGLNDTTPDGTESAIVVRRANQNKNSPPEFLNSMRVNITRLDTAGWTLESTRNVYVSQIPSQQDEAQIRGKFSPFGEIKELRVIPSKDDSRGGVAFVHYSAPDSATKAVAEMHDFMPEECVDPLSVRFANISRSNYPEQFDPKYLKMMEATTNIYVTQMPNTWTTEKIKELFKVFGNVKDVRLLGKKSSNPNGGVAFVHFEDQISATRAVSRMNNTKQDDSEMNILVQFAKVHPGTFDNFPEVYDDFAAAGFQSYY